MALVAIQIVPHEGQWMWAASMSSQAGGYTGYAPLPKWGNFSATPFAALQRALLEVEQFKPRMNVDEYKRVNQWLEGEVAERLVQLRSQATGKGTCL